MNQNTEYVNFFRRIFKSEVKMNIKYIGGFKMSLKNEKSGRTRNRIFICNETAKTSCSVSKSKLPIIY